MKKKMMIAISLLAVVAIIAGGTFAWFTASTDPVVNEFKAGTLEMELKDIYCYEDNVNPGDCIDKLVYVKNTGTKRMFVRVKLTPEFVDMPNGDLDLVDYPILNDWVLHTDGYYYYPHELQPGTMTMPLIEEVCFDGPGMGNEYQGVMFNLTVESDAIQVTNGAAEDVWEVNPLELDID